MQLLTLFILLSLSLSTSTSFTIPLVRNAVTTKLWVNLEDELGCRHETVFKPPPGAKALLNDITREQP